jgi:histidyl-tRNA synthetase
LLASFVGNTPEGLILSYGVIGGLGVGFAYVTPIATSIKWFPDRRGFIAGLSVMGFGIGSLVFAPLLEALRALGVSVLMHAGGGSMKAQFRRADTSGARFALVFGADEVSNGQVALKSLRDGAGAQSLQPLAAPATWAHLLQSSV